MKKKKGKSLLEICREYKETLEDVLEWTETGMIEDVHYDQQSITDRIKEVLIKKL